VDSLASTSCERSNRSHAHSSFVQLSPPMSFLPARRREAISFSRSGRGALTNLVGNDSVRIHCTFRPRSLLARRSADGEFTLAERTRASPTLFARHAEGHDLSCIPLESWGTPSTVPQRTTALDARLYDNIREAFRACCTHRLNTPNETV
jgi:hypothetical protein